MSIKAFYTFVLAGNIRAKASSNDDSLDHESRTRVLPIRASGISRICENAPLPSSWWGTLNGPLYAFMSSGSLLP
jgi:hypothetical protein